MPGMRWRPRLTDGQELRTEIVYYVLSRVLSRRYVYRVVTLSLIAGLLTGTISYLQGGARSSLVGGVLASVSAVLLLTSLLALLALRSAFRRWSDDTRELRRYLRRASWTMRRNLRGDGKLLTAFHVTRQARKRLYRTAQANRGRPGIAATEQHWLVRLNRWDARILRAYRSQEFLQRAATELSISGNGSSPFVLFVYDGTRMTLTEWEYVERILDEYRVDHADYLDRDTSVGGPLARSRTRVLLHAPSPIWSGLQRTLPAGFIGPAVEFPRTRSDLETVRALWESDGEGPMGEIVAVVAAVTLLSEG
jgi:hypothetical protein